MQTRSRKRITHVLLAAAAVFAPAAANAQDGPLPCDRLAAIIGGQANAGDPVCKVTLPRDELGVTLLGAHLPPGMGLTSWAAFLPTGEGTARVMGDLALTAGELPRVMRGLREAGIRVTAVHRHMLAESPAMSFMHYMGTGEPTELAQTLRAALERAPGTLGRAQAVEGPAPSRSGLVAGVPCRRIREILGAGDAGAGPGYCKVSVPRTDLSVRVDGAPVPASMGIGSWFAFKQTPDGDAAVIAGDMALREAQVNPAVEALVRRGIDVVALHNHMLFDEPRVVFFHFQARGEPERLAEALRAGLDAAERAAARADAAGG